MTDSLRRFSIAQDAMVLLAVALSGFFLVLGGGMLPLPMIGCLGLPLALLAGAAFSVAVLACGRLEVPWWRQTLGVLLAIVGLALFARAYLAGLEIIAEHFLDHAGAPSLLELIGPASSLALSALTVCAAAQLRRRSDRWAPFVLGALVGFTGVFAWAFLIVLGVLDVPFGA